MNNDLISRSELKKKLQARYDNSDEDFDKGYNIGIETAVALLNSAPTIEHRDNFDLGYIQGLEDGKNEKPKGEWIRVNNKSNTGCWYKCDKCGCEEVMTTPFCPFCGADMRGEV